MQKLYFPPIIVLGFLLLSALPGQSQNCPKLKSAMIASCGREGVNEFIMFQTGGQTVTLANIKLEYSTTISFTPGASTVVINPNSAITAWKNPAILPANGLTNSLGTITAINPTTTTTIAPNSTVVIIPEGGALTNPYDLQLTGQVLVLFYDTTKTVGTSTSWTGTGNFANFGSAGVRFFRLTTNTGGSCSATQATSYTPANLIRQNGTVGNQAGARTNWDDAADATVTPSDNNGTVHYVNKGCTAIALPIKLVYFNGSVMDGHISLYWEIGSGSNAISFRVERSRNGDTYKTIGNVAAQAGDNTWQYSFTDDLPGAGNNFYRLVMEDADHQLSYSNVVVLDPATTNRIRIYPNPVKDRVTINIGNTSNDMISLINSNGQIMLTRSFSGDSTITLDLSGYATGMYLLRIVNGEQISSYKLYKQ